MKVNYGGFVDLSTIDWPGRAVCTVFFRGCPLRCSYCHNATIQAGSDPRDTNEILDAIRDARMLVSGVIFSGGEPTMQAEPLVALAGAVKEMGLAVGVQTNGYFPDTLALLIDGGLVDRIALDYKTRWEGFSKRWEGYAGKCAHDYTTQAARSLKICDGASQSGRLPDFEVVLTIFGGNEKEVLEIASHLPRGTLVLQQGVFKRFWKDWEETGNGDLSDEEIASQRPPLTVRELEHLAGKINRLGRTIKIRTHEAGELLYEGHRSRRAACKW
jgi:pyruvate formate lyase activating enzyme